MLELKNISFHVQDDPEMKNKEILHNISLTVDEKSFFVITGPNGGGKSTLAKIIMGIKKPTEGQIIFDGQDITDLDITERAHLGIGFALQQPVRFKGLTVQDLLALSAGKNLDVSTACTYLSEVGLCAKDYIQRELNTSLSGGELKRIEIAMQIARAPKLSVFDEPEAGIDLWSFQNLIQVFETMRNKIAGSIIIISHQERILEIADKIAVIANGRVISEGTKEEVMPRLLHDSGPCEYYKEVRV